MANKIPLGGYECSFCHKKFSHALDADICRDDHELVYVAFTRTDLNRLIMFVHLKQDELLTESLINSLTKYQPKVD